MTKAEHCEHGVSLIWSHLRAITRAVIRIRGKISALKLNNTQEGNDSRRVHNETQPQGLSHTTTRWSTTKAKNSLQSHWDHMLTDPLQTWICNEQPESHGKAKTPSASTISDQRNQTSGCTATSSPISPPTLSDLKTSTHRNS